MGDWQGKLLAGWLFTIAHITQSSYLQSLKVALLSLVDGFILSIPTCHFERSCILNEAKPEI
jgi:hypothetical protein